MCAPAARVGAFFRACALYNTNIDARETKNFILGRRSFSHIVDCPAR